MKPRNLWVLILCMSLGLGFLGKSVTALPLYPYKDIGDGKPATQVTLTLVDGLAMDRAGNIYIAHRSKNRIRKLTPDGIITTVVGNGIAGFSGDGGPALEASLNFPAGLVVDDDGSIYIADRNNHRIRKVNADGIITTVAGNGIPDWSGDNESAVNASLNFPSDVALDSEKNLFISDRSNNRIRKVDNQGIITTIAGTGPPGFGGDFRPAVDALLKYPFGIFIDPQENLYIADRGNNRIRMIDKQGIITTVAGDGMHSYSGDYGPATQASLAFPTDVVKDDAGNIFITDRNNNRIRKVDPVGIITTFMGTGQSDFNGDGEIAAETNLYLPLVFVIDSKNQNLIVADRSHFRIRKAHLKNQIVSTLAGNGRSLQKGDGGPGLGATLDGPSGIVIDSKGNILFADKNHNRIRKIDKHGIISGFAGTGALGNEGDGGPALKAALFLPSLMAIDADDNVFVVCRLGHGFIIRKISAQGTITRFAGNGRQGNEGDGGPAINASFYTITDIVTDIEGNLYIADQTNFNIRKVDRNGIISKVVGEKIKNLGEEVHLNGLVIDEAGNIYFSDSGSSKVRKIFSDGKTMTIAGTGDFKNFGSGGPALKAGVRSPGGLTLSPQGELYICEQNSAVIRKIDKDGIIHRVAGTGEPGFSGDGGPAPQARLKNPFRVVFDPAGNLYFSDRDNNRIRKIDTRGIISTIAGNGNIGWMQDGLEVRITVHNFP